MSLPMPLVLCAEDEESDAFILQRAFTKAGIVNPLFIVKDGQEAVDYLAGRDPYGDRNTHPLPALLLLDLKMPRLSGFDVLAWMGAHAEFRSIPTLVLSSSSADTDIRKARDLGARDYLIKPNDLPQYVKVIQDLAAQWLNPSRVSPKSSN